MSSDDVIVEITTPFSTRRMPMGLVNWKGLRALRAFYKSPVGLTVLQEYAEDERLFRESQKEAGIASPTQVHVGATVQVRLLNASGEPLDEAILAAFGSVFKEDEDDSEATSNAT